MNTTEPAQEICPPVATPRCEKVLLWDRSDGERWPVPCFPAVVPQWCREPGFFCYANLENGKYTFAGARIPEGQHMKVRREMLWPASAEAAKAMRTFIVVLLILWGSVIAVAASSRFTSRRGSWSAPRGRR